MGVGHARHIHQHGLPFVGTQGFPFHDVGGGAVHPAARQTDGFHTIGGHGIGQTIQGISGAVFRHSGEEYALQGKRPGMSGQSKIKHLRKEVVAQRTHGITFL